MKDLGNLKKKEILKQEENSADSLPAQYLLKKNLSPSPPTVTIPEASLMAHW